MSPLPSSPRAASLQEVGRDGARGSEPKLRTRFHATCRRAGYSLHVGDGTSPIAHLPALGRALPEVLSSLPRYAPPAHLRAEHVDAFLTHLATTRKVAAATQRQALNALAFLYHQVLGVEIGVLDFRRAKKPVRLPTVLTREEVWAVLGGVRGTAHLVASLLYGSGLRLAEALRLRVRRRRGRMPNRAAWQGQEGSQDGVAGGPRRAVDASDGQGARMA